MPTKSIFTSKTAAVQAITAVVAFIPSARELVAQYPGETLMAVAVINVVMRFITKGRVTLF